MSPFFNRTHRSRRGEAATITAVALASMFVTFYSSLKSAGEMGAAAEARNDLIQQSGEISKQCQGLLELKTHRMFERGEISRAQRDLAISRIRDSQNERVFRQMVGELIQKQSQIVDEKFNDFCRNAAVNLGFLGLGQYVIGGQHVGRDLFQASEISRFGLFTDLSSMGLTGAQEGFMGGRSPVLTEEEFLAALDRAEQRLGGDDQRDMRATVRARVRAFFDKWHMDNIQRLSEAYFEEHRETYRDQCDADFEAFVENELRASGWDVQPEGLGSFAWSTLKNYVFYRQTFPPEDEIYHVENFDKPGETLGSEDGEPLILKRKVRIDDFTGDEEIVFTLVIPESVPMEDLNQVGLNSRRLEFPMEKVETGAPDTWRLVNRGPEAKRVADTVAKIAYQVAQALTSIFGGGGDDDRGSVTAENAVLTVEPIPGKVGELVVTLSMTLVTSGPDSDGQWRTERENQSHKLRAILQAEDLVGDF